MAQILLMPVGSHGDVHPFIALGQALQARGHDVTVITSAYFEALAKKAGLPFVGVGTAADFQACLDHPEMWHPTRGFRAVAEWGVLPWMRTSYQMVAERFVPGKTVVVSSGLGFGPRIAHDKLGVPLATIHLQPSMLYSKYAPPHIGPSVERPWMFPRAIRRFAFWLGYRYFVNPVVAARTNAFRAELGLPPVQHFMDRWIHSPQCVICFFPDWFGPRQPDWPAHVIVTGFPLFDERGLAELPPEVDAFLGAGEPPIVFTPGSAMKQGQAFFATAVDACAKLGRRGMLLTRFPEQVPRSLPDGIRHFEYVPFSQVFPRAAAVVHHGGVGTTAQALIAAAPQLIMYMSHDQPDNAARVARLGVGKPISTKAFHGPAVAKALGDLLQSPDVAQRCRAVAKLFEGADPLSEACRAIEGLVGIQPVSLTA
jgi:UDP:flavonoid glycosyltransferase YjiC (YdhE family)